MSNDGTAVRHPIFARLYHKLSVAAEDAGEADHRRELLAGVTGRVVEVGAGNGLNFEHYPATVKEVMAVEPEPYLRERAARAAEKASVPVTVVDGVADSLPLDDASMDAAVASLVLCSVPSQDPALAEIRRVLRAGGELRFYEHVRAERPGFARVQRAVDVVWPHMGGGCHTSRDTVAAIERAGFGLESLRRFEFRPSPLVAPAAPHVLGRARRR
jgi:ubiquinone/menaquinone biosynthesis C-methylase UbiE